MAPLKYQIVSSENIQRMFNESQYPTMIQQGLLLKKFLRNDHLKHPEEKNEPNCTHSQAIRYSNNQGQLVVEVHQYLRNDGTIGGSGKADPKRLIIEDTVYSVYPIKESAI